jgi:hypothetical protein
LGWYTKDTAVYKILNNILRSGRHPTEIFYIQPFFKILFGAIEYLFGKHYRSNPKKKSPFVCYRGAKMIEK